MRAGLRPQTTAQRKARVNRMVRKQNQPTAGVRLGEISRLRKCAARNSSKGETVALLVFWQMIGYDTNSRK